MPHCLHRKKMKQSTKKYTRYLQQQQHGEPLQQSAEDHNNYTRIDRAAVEVGKKFNSLLGSLLVTAAVRQL